MALIERYVDTDVAVTGDGSAASPWKTLAEAFPVGARPAGLASTDQYMVYYSGASVDPAQVTVDASYAGMTVTVEGEASGRLDTNVARLTSGQAATSVGAFYVASASVNLTMRRVQVVPVGTGASRAGVRVTSTSLVTLDRCVIDVRGLTGSSSKGAWASADSRLRMLNCLVIGGASANPLVQGTSNVVARLYGCTLVGNGGLGLLGSFAGIIANNCRFVDCGADYSGTVDGAGNASTNAASVGTSPAVSQAFAFVDAANGDYHITAGDPCNATGVDLRSDPTLPVTQDVDGDELTPTPPSGYDYYSVPIVATQIAITAQPAAAVSVGDTVTVVAAGQNGAGVTQTDYVTTGAWKLRARSAPTGWDLTTILDSDTPASGVAALTFAVPMAGAWTFGVDDDANALTDSAASGTVTATMPTGGGTTIISGGALTDMDLLKGGSSGRRTLVYRATSATTGAPVTDLIGKPSISVAGGAASTTPAAVNATHVDGGYYRVEIADAAITGGDDVIVTAHGTALIETAVGRVVGIDVAVAASSDSDVAAAVWAASTRTLSSFGTLAADAAAAVWATVTKAVTSVTGAVGSVTGNVGGNVAGSVGSVTAGVSIANGAITDATFSTRLQRFWAKMLNKRTLTGTAPNRELVVYGEDGVTEAFRESVAGTGAVSITGITPQA